MSHELYSLYWDNDDDNLPLLCQECSLPLDIGQTQTESHDIMPNGEMVFSFLVCSRCGHRHNRGSWIDRSIDDVLGIAGRQP